MPLHCDEFLFDFSAVDGAGVQVLLVHQESFLALSGILDGASGVPHALCIMLIKMAELFLDLPVKILHIFL